MIIFQSIFQVVVFIITVFFTIYLITRLFPIIEVVGESMYPTYEEGDILLSNFLFRRKNLKIGDVLISHPPYDMGEVRIIIKRVQEILYDADGTPIAVYLVGDNRDHSYDSRDYGYVDIHLVISKVIRPREMKRGDM